MQNTIYSEWLNALPESDPLRKELLSIQDDPKEIEDRFYRGLAFGTGGLRGIIGAGTNRMNISRLLLLFNNLSLIVKNITIILSDSTIKS